ncbi:MULTISPECIES: S8 family serine peptidase [unclassified Leptolyngbya]|uniref:S8 family serine peptidase n=1 Tax=unclassified Leptolyngbya TaxID=2650499 RepID=UPI001685942B|nr:MULTISPECIES: S8 family serine peptidase [unclassified Leptolyngbya]MBD1912969.1 S8 family serine peptidase [Leptolyngbya sp. FACHB-8]MBD2155720.1 S8 family serine peptidase [Leptolyngbya sp. FACHB-16]
MTTPNDPLFSQQWHLSNTGQSGGTAGMDLNVLPVWDDYTGRGVRVGVMDDSVEYLHPDLNDNYDTSIDIDTSERDDDAAPTWYDDIHGTSVAGLIAAEANNGIGGTGVAPDATLAGIRLDFYDYNFEANASYGFRQMANFDVVNNSWGYSYPFYDNFDGKPGMPFYRDALQYAVENGRGGLGTSIVFAAGNSRTWGDNANFHNLNNSRFTIAVAALTHTGVHTYYSSPGVNLLVSAFGGDTPEDGIVTTDRTGYDGYSGDDYTNQFGGTSSAAPMVTGVIALMLEANPNLGYRDVQEILAYSARQVDVDNNTWLTNGATNWNGGGLHHSSDYGFGLVDARAAVRLAETWTTQHTYSNEAQAQVSSSPAAAIPDNGEVSSQITLTEEMDIDHVEVVVDISHTWIGDLELVLTSPDGTESILTSRPGATEFSPNGLDSDNLRFTFGTTQFWGEESEGTWTLTVRDRALFDTGVLQSWTLRVYGDENTSDNVYIYTDAYGTVPNDSARTTLTDNSGLDTLNAAATTTDLVLNLTAGSTSTIAGRTLTIAADTTIEQAFSGDGNDTISGNDAANFLRSGRGNDNTTGAAGNDIIWGEQGNDRLNGSNGSDSLIGGAGADNLLGGAASDRLTGGDGADTFRFAANSAFGAVSLGIDLITDFINGVDRIMLSKSTFSALLSTIGTGFSQASEFAQVANNTLVDNSSALIVYSQASNTLYYNANGTELGLGDGGRFAILRGVANLTAQSFILQA